MKIVATGTAFPKTLLTNEMLAAAYPDWDIERLVTRTGVSARYVADASETALDLAEAAANNMADAHAVNLSGIDALIVCTESPDYPVPGNACILQHRLGIRENAFCLDINMGCSAFPYLLQIARGLMQGGIAETVLILTADTYTRYIHPLDRSTRALFGDGAAATLTAGMTLPLSNSYLSSVAAAICLPGLPSNEAAHDIRDRPKRKGCGKRKTAYTWMA